MEHITKREGTLLKIELAQDALREARLSAPFKHTARKTPKRMAMGTKGMDTIVRSNKYLCGILGEYCKAMRKHGIEYPWREDA